MKNHLRLGLVLAVTVLISGCASADPIPLESQTVKPATEQPETEQSPAPTVENRQGKGTFVPIDTVSSGTFDVSVESVEGGQAMVIKNLILDTPYSTVSLSSVHSWDTEILCDSEDNGVAGATWSFPPASPYSELFLMYDENNPASEILLVGYSSEGDSQVLPNGCEGGEYVAHATIEW